MDPGNRIFRIIQATILELNIKGFIKIYEDSNKRIILKMLEKDTNELTSTQNAIYDFIRKISNENNELEAEEWKAFQRHLRNYTLIKEYKTQSLIINQKFLIYATLFGIADKVQWDLGKFKPIIFWNY